MRPLKLGREHRSQVWERNLCLHMRLAEFCLGHRRKGEVGRVVRNVGRRVLVTRRIQLHRVAEMVQVIDVVAWSRGWSQNVATSLS